MTSRFNFRRITKSRPANPAAYLKAIIVLIFSGFCSHILFIEMLIILFKLDLAFLYAILITNTGLPEIDMLTPLVLVVISPILLLFSNPLVFFLSLLPWILAGFITGIIFGPTYDKAILFGPPTFVSIIFGLIILFLFSLIGFTFATPSISILTLIFLLLYLAITFGGVILIISFPIIIPSLIGYSIGKKYSNNLFPLVFFAQPNRIDPNQTRCQYLNDQNQCLISKKDFIPNLCDNKFNQVTCTFYMYKKGVKYKKNLFG